MKGKHLGEFEELVLLVVASLDNYAYAVTVQSEITNKADRKVNISAVHTALYRLEDKGYLASEMGGATATRGGKQKRMFRVTSAGFATLQSAKMIREKLWREIPRLSFGN